MIHPQRDGIAPRDAGCRMQDAENQLVFAPSNDANQTPFCFGVFLQL
jgi:hypothetical protein